MAPNPPPGGATVTLDDLPDVDLLRYDFCHATIHTSTRACLPHTDVRSPHARTHPPVYLHTLALIIIMRAQNAHLQRYERYVVFWDP